MRKYSDPINPRESALRLFFVNMQNGVVVVNPATKSRYNLENIEIITDFLTQLRVAIADQRDNVAIITPYRDQVRAHQSRILEEVRRQSLPISVFPQVRTIDSSQGDQFKVGIFDSVISQADRASDMGFIALTE